MATIYVRSTDGSDADNGSTWALAKATLIGADGIDAAGDTIWVSQAHNESSASNINPTFAGTKTSPTRLLCGNDAAEPPTSLTTGGTVSTTGAATITIGGSVYIYGLTFQSGDSTSGNTIATGTNNSRATWENCVLYVKGTGASGGINIGTSGSSLIQKNCTYRLSATGQAIKFNGGDVQLLGCSFHASTTTPSSIFSPLNPGILTVSGCDFSNLSSTVNIAAPALVGLLLKMRDCRLPASWSGAVVSSAVTAPGNRYEMYNCDSAGTNYALWIEDYYGTIKQETTLVRTGGASDGTTTISWNLTTNSGASYPIGGLVTPEIQLWNDTSGASKTLTVEILHDSATNLKNDEVWLEVMYLGSASYPLGTWITNAKTDVLATAADQTTSSATWTTTGMSNPNKQKLSVTFTPNMKGPYVCRVVLAKASKTVYVDPVVTVT